VAKEKQESPPSGDYTKLGAWLRKVGISYSTYRTMRAEGKAPRELRPTKRTILITKEAEEAWRGLGVAAPSEGEQMQLGEGA
jgi:hypothetical protein